MSHKNKGSYCVTKHAVLLLLIDLFKFSILNVRFVSLNQIMHLIAFFGYFMKASHNLQPEICLLVDLYENKTYFLSASAANFGSNSLSHTLCI